MRTPSIAEEERWAKLAEESGNLGEGGSIIRFGGTDIITYQDGLYVKVLTPLPAFMLGPDEQGFERTGDGEIIIPLDGWIDMFESLREDATAPEETRAAARELCRAIQAGLHPPVLLPASTDVIEVVGLGDDGRECPCEAIPPESEFRFFPFDGETRWEPLRNPEDVA